MPGRREMQHRNQRLSLRPHQRPPRPRFLLNWCGSTMARDLAVMRNSVEQLAAKQEHRATAQEQLAAKQEQMAQNIATLQAAEQDIIQTRSSPPLSGPVSPPPRKKARRVAPPKLAAQSSSVPFPAFRPQ